MKSRDVTSKNIDGITDLVVVAPIRDDFIVAYENVTYASRLKLVAEALNRVRVSAREHERVTPFSDVTERILTLLDFRVGIIDKDLFGLSAGTRADGGRGLESRRYLYLTATFDGAWEPYMRLIWRPLGPFLDLLFCNCDGYVTATDHSFDEYAQWVRDNQMDSAIFYGATGLTVRDHLYLANLERLQRQGADGLALAEMVMPDPETLAARDRGNPATLRKTLELGLEALTVLYKLADYYPPEWLTGHPAMNEGRLLAQVARDLLLGWDDLTVMLDALPANSEPAQRWAAAKRAYAEPLGWYLGGKQRLAELDVARAARRLPDPPFDAREVQGGILKPQGSLASTVKQGALMLFTIRDAKGARAMLDRLGVDYATGDGTDPTGGFFRTVGFTPQGLEWIGLPPDVIDQFPKEFRDGMAARSGLFGDMRENHPRNWILPERNGPALTGAIPPGTVLPPVEPAEIDFVIQLRTTSADRTELLSEMRRIADDAAPGATLEAFELLEIGYAADGSFIDHFGLRDGLSQPRPDLPGAPAQGRDRVAPGEILLGYGNDRWDGAPGDFASFPGWRKDLRRQALDLQKNGTFLVVRKIEQRVDAIEAFVRDASAQINAAHPDLIAPMDPDRLKARILGRWPDGRPLVPPGPGGQNDFDYAGDARGRGCPLAAHVRRANPREGFQNRPAPRILRRGMPFDHRDTDGNGARGLMFMCYNTSIAEQYETIQRWLNGGNSTHVASAHNDPLTGVQPKSGTGTFRFVEPGQNGPVNLAIALPAVTQDAPGRDGEPGRHPFTPLHWGLYLFVPSRSALARICALEGRYHPMREFRETHGDAVIERIKWLDPEQQGCEWKRLLEDFTAKDPSERNLSPEMWAAIRWYKGGSLNLRTSMPMVGYNWEKPDRKDQNVILCASPRHVRQVLSDSKSFTSEEQLRRIAGNAGPIYVAQQPDNVYRNAALQGLALDYKAESGATNAILMACGEDQGFAAGYAAGAAVLAEARKSAAAGGRDYYKIELRRQFLMPALGVLCRILYGLPDEVHMALAGWAWNPVHDRGEGKPRCPGDFLAPSRFAFYPRPSDTVERFADDQGQAILDASRAFVATHRPRGNGKDTGSIARAMFAAIADDEVLARNLIGTMVGAIPPMDGHLRGILLEWLGEQTLWRHQAAQRRALAGQPAATAFDAVRSALFTPVSQAMCKRPAPDLLYRTATTKTVLEPGHRPFPQQPDPVVTEEGDLVIVSLVSASQWSLTDPDKPDGELAIVFGGARAAPCQDDPADPAHPAHACPAQALATGAIMGILASLLDAGRIQALPASLIVRISDWSPPTPPPA